MDPATGLLVGDMDGVNESGVGDIMTGKLQSSGSNNDGMTGRMILVQRAPRSKRSIYDLASFHLKSLSSNKVRAGRTGYKA